MGARRNRVLPAIVAGAMAALATAAAADDIERLCAEVLDHGRCPDRTLEQAVAAAAWPPATGAMPTAGEERSAAASCVLEVRGARTATGGGSARGCEALDRLAALPTVEIRRRLATAEPGTPTGCAALLRCLLERRAQAAHESGAADRPLDAAWRAAFERVCGRAEGATTLERDELEALARESSELLARIEGQTSAEARVYRLRLDGCRMFFEYALDLLDAKAAPPR